MLSRLRRRLTYTNLAATLALVFAMTGGAYAANKFLISSTKQISPKVLKQLKGANGKDGAPGPTGPAGPAGAKGDTGLKGETGLQGAPGAPGKDGKEGKEGPQSQPGKEGKEGPEGPEGTAGKDGAPGKEGSPWTAGGVLPDGKTETGMFAATGMPATVFKVFFGVSTSLSFPIPLKEGEKPTVHVIGESEKGTGKGNGESCPETSSLTKPEAEPGNLCVFVYKQENVEAFFISPTEGASEVGEVMIARAQNHETAVTALGTWAVTAK